MSTGHLAPFVFPFSGVSGDADGASLTATGVLATHRVCGCWDATNAVAYDGNDFETAADVIVNNTGVDLTGATLNFILAGRHERG